ncbi:MAG: hypothetical protein ABI612_24225, partial [Betaproteobacteria bacterium]
QRRQMLSSLPADDASLVIDLVRRHPAGPWLRPIPVVNPDHFAPNDAPGEWRSQARDYANTRYSALEQVNTGDVARLKIAWSSLTALGPGTKPPHSCSTTRCI